MAFLNCAPDRITEITAWLNTVTVEPDIDPVAFHVLAKPVNLFLVFSDIRDEDMEWLVVGHWSKTRLLKGWVMGEFNWLGMEKQGAENKNPNNV